MDLQGGTIRDLTADGLGCFRNHGTNKWVYKKKGLKWRCTKKKFRGAVDREQLPDDSVVVVKEYYKHKDYNDFHRTISYLQDSRAKVVDNLAIVTYRFDNNEHTINLRPHGNSKRKNVGFTRKKPSLVSQVSATATKSSVTSAVERNIADHGGRANISDELRGTKAALYRLNSQPHTQQDEDFAAVMEWAAENRDVCRVIASHPEPVIVLATDQQLTDLERFTGGKSSNQYQSLLGIPAAIWVTLNV